jgi:hypothetical protein
MSVKMMTLVFERFPLAGNDRLLALALADHAHDDGTHIFPGNEKLAKKTRISERTVIRLLQKFVKIGWLIKRRSAHSGRGYSNEFFINPQWISGVELDEIELDESAQKGDKLSPLLEIEKGDKNNKRVTSDANKGDIAVSPQQELTINTTINTARETVDEKPKQYSTPEGEYACRLIPLGVSVTSMHPTLHKWVQEKIPIELIVQCVGIARQQKPLPETIAANYLDKIVRSELTPKVDNSWQHTEKGLLAKGKELGVMPRTGESWPDFKARLVNLVNGNKGVRR